MSKSINRFLIEKGIKSNTQKITILHMVKWVDEWQEQVKNFSIPDVVGSYTHVELKETITDKQVFLLPANQCEITLIAVDKKVGKINL